MKIVVTAVGPEPSSAVDSRFGRAPWLHVIDTETGESRTIDNMQNAQGRSGVGVTTAQRVVDSGADVVMTGRVGPNAQRVLEGAGIEMVLGILGASVAEAVASYAGTKS